MTLNNIVLSSAAIIIGAALFIGTPVYAAEKSTLTDPSIASLWAQIEVLQKQIAELQAAQKAMAKTVEPVVTTTVVATSTATSSAATTSSMTTKAKAVPQKPKTICYGNLKIICVPAVWGETVKP
jgi:hypothetical protein